MKGFKFSGKCGDMGGFGDAEIRIQGFDGDGTAVLVGNFGLQLHPIVIGGDDLGFAWHVCALLNGFSGYAGTMTMRDGTHAGFWMWIFLA